ncbi:MAG: hypothetical protein GY711_33980 [bacterium]|nr:hypothetical protein [bacterium]
MLNFPFVPLLLVGIGAVAVQDPEPRSGPKCRSCKSVGWVACTEHKADVCALEGEVFYCSFVAGCETCAGIGHVDCEKCENEAAQEELEQRRARRAVAEPKLLEFDAAMERPLRKGESEHFRLVWELDSLKVGRKRLDDHALLHLYLDRLEELYRVYVETLGGVHPREFSDKPSIFVWYLPQDQRDASLRFCSTSGQTGVKLMGPNPRFSMCANKQYINSDEQLHRYMFHNVTHLMFASQKPSYWIGQLKGGAWADEGLAHWMEVHFFGIADTYCYQEQNTKVGFKGGKYRPAVRKMVAMDKLPPVADVMRRVTNTLTAEENAVAYSYVDYLISLSGEKFNNIGRKLRRKMEPRKALSEVFGMNPLKFEEQWKAWVLATYPSR